MTLVKKKNVWFKTAPAKGEEHDNVTVVTGLVPRDKKKAAALSSLYSVIVNAVGVMTIEGVSLSVHETISLIAPLLTNDGGPDVIL